MDGTISTPIIGTKLFIPPPRPRAVLRPRLVKRLEEGRHRKLTLLSAPAGFGKTTLVSEWLAAPEGGSPAGQKPFGRAWLSLDEGDNDPTRFLAYLVAALQTIAPAVGAGVWGLLQSSQPALEPSGREALLAALVNDIAAIPDYFVLVLDDYHVIDASPVDQILAFLVEHLPPQVHLVITTREDPQLPLARLRARGQLAELRAADLRFTPAEAADFLSQAMGLSLSATEIAALEERTEGWIAGLQLAALSMQGREDVAGFVRTFAGDNRYIVDYLVEEVLQRQPERVRRFLLQTSILDRLSGPLCDAVTGQHDAAELLELLERNNLFVAPLDDRRHWYRYHHLFAEVLYAHLRVEQPDAGGGSMRHQVATLHLRASAWYEQHGSPAEAIRHALAAEDFARAAALVELAWPAMRRSRQEAVLLGWLKTLPGELIRRRPVLVVAYAHVLLASGKLEGVEERLRNAEQWLDATADMRVRADAVAAGMVVVDDEEFRRLPGAIAIARAGLALAVGNVPETVICARRALDLAPENDHLTRGAAAGFLGLASWTSGDLETAHRTYGEGMTSLQKAGNLADAANGAIALANIRIAQGRLREAMGAYERGLQLATTQGLDGSLLVLRGAADMHVGMSELHCERGDLQTAMQHLLRSKELGEHTGFPQNRYRWSIALARVRQAQGDLDTALDLLTEAEHLYMSDFSPNVRPIAALKARVWVARGRVGEALGWARAQGLSAHDDLSYLREFEHITLARVLLACYQRDHAGHALLEAMELLERLRQAAEEGERIGSVIEILILQALAHQMHGDTPAALAPLARALTLAGPEGYVRIFVDEGPPMALLLRQAAAPGGRPAVMPAYTDKLLAAFATRPPGSAGASPLPTPLAAQPLIEPLSQRELEVLRLFKSELSGPEIARELVIALSTVRTHTKRIYSKLNVTNRRAAVKRATELDLI